MKWTMDIDIAKQYVWTGMQKSWAPGYDDEDNIFYRSVY
jgi:hypothetical protein